jgi:hypothetical protein
MKPTKTFLLQTAAVLFWLELHISHGSRFWHRRWNSERFVGKRYRGSKSHGHR